jgi:hypothetical protein
MLPADCTAANTIAQRKPRSAPMISWLTSASRKVPASSSAVSPVAARGATSRERATDSIPLIRNGMPENENGGARIRKATIRTPASMAASTYAMSRVTFTAQPLPATPDPDTPVPV